MARERAEGDDGGSFFRRRIRREPSFAEVLAEAKANSPAAFRALYAALASSVSGYLRSQGVADVEDTTSDVFLGVFTGLRSFTGTEEQFRSWVFTIAHRRVVDGRRRSERLPRLQPNGTLRFSPPAVPGEANVEDEALAEIDCEGIRRLLDRLSPDQRDVLVLRIIGDLSVDQTADVLGKTPWAVKALQRRGVATLRRLVTKAGVTW